MPEQALQQYSPGQLQLVRDVLVPISDNRAYRVQEKGTRRRLTPEPVTEQQGMLLMRQLGSPYLGLKYDENIWRVRDERDRRTS